MGTLSLNAPWLTFDLGAEHQILSWSLNHPGFCRPSQIHWREVLNRDLPEDLDVYRWVDEQLAAREQLDAVLFLTSRDVTCFEERRSLVGDVTAHAVATVGLTNAERVGARVDYSSTNLGTINVALQLSTDLSQGGLLQAMSIAVQARTVAVMDAGIQLSTGIATGTGTDCVAIAAPTGKIPYAGLHTDTGHAIGRAVYDAVHAGALAWITENDARRIDERHQKGDQP